MWILFPLLLGVSLAMDALGVSLALGAAERNSFTWKKILLASFSFGFFQTAMPVAGWLLGAALCGDHVITLGRIVAFLLLAFLGGKMVYEGVKRKGEEKEEKEEKRFSFSRLLVLSLATSIDALLVGVSYACIGRGGILRDSVIIGLVTFLICFCGGFLGRAAGRKLGGKGDIFGGVILLLLAVKILLE
ncbi:MAG: manganese efflux pump [Lentisphaeria bacterium]|nr:manganese efflux pump [Lentisphaeria bacterium]